MSLKKYITDNPLLMSDWKRNTLNPDTITLGSAKICYWKCSTCGHLWETPAYSRGSNNCGCPECAKKIRGQNKKKSSAQKNSFLENFPEIAREWHPTKNDEYNVENVSSFSNIKVWWLCSTCGNEWRTTVNHRTKEGNSCPKCSKEKSAKNKIAFHAKANNFAVQYPEIAKEWHPTKNGDLTPDNVSKSSNLKVWWKCSFCGRKWKTSVRHRTSGQNCPNCNKYQTSFPEQAIFYYVSLLYPDTLNRQKIDGFEFDILVPSKKIAIEYDGTRYHNTKKALLRDNKKDDLCQTKSFKLFRFRDSILPNTNSAIRITCNEKNIDFGIKQLLSLINPNHTLNIDSQKDRVEIIKNTKQILIANNIFSLRPNLTNEWNYEKNESLLPQSVAANANYKVWWLCSKCGCEWQATPNHRFSGTGCPVCVGKVCRTGYNDLLTKNPEVASEWNYERNLTDTPQTIAFKSNKKVWWKCKKGHEWEATVSERNRGDRATNCPYCSNKKILAGYNDLNTTCPTLSKQWHPTKNGDLKPTMVSAGSKKKVWWICEKGHEWEAVIYSRKRGTGCPICYKENQK